jgi:hypothetical protein
MVGVGLSINPMISALDEQMRALVATTPGTAPAQPAAPAWSRSPRYPQAVKANAPPATRTSILLNYDK